MSSDNLPPILRPDDGNLYIRVTPKGDFLRVPMYEDFWTLVHETRYFQFCHHMDHLNQTQYIGSQNMSVVWNSLCLYHYEQWNQVGKKTDEEKLACFDAALHMPTDADTVNKMRKYWKDKKTRFGIKDELADSIPAHELRDLESLGLTTDDPGAKKNKRKLIVPACASWDNDKKIDADDFTADDLAFMEAQEAEAEKGAEDDTEDFDAMDLDD